MSAFSTEAAALPQPPLAFGDFAQFEATVSGQVSSKADVYVKLICWQGDTIVYQNTAPVDYAFPLVDLTGQNLEWDGGDAVCEGWLVYRVDKGKSSEITVLDIERFAVTGASLSA